MKIVYKIESTWRRSGGPDGTTYSNGGTVKRDSASDISVPQEFNLSAPEKVMVFKIGQVVTLVVKDPEVP